MAFETLSDATRLWIKGHEFSVKRLLGDSYKGQTEKFIGGVLAIFRLAPQDYHRFHVPVDGVIGSMTDISGEDYTVNVNSVCACCFSTLANQPPQAIRTSSDVYGDNGWEIVPIDSPQFGWGIAMCVGAVMVGSIHTTVEEGQDVKRGEEFGYFALGKLSHSSIHHCPSLPSQRVFLS